MQFCIRSLFSPFPHPINWVVKSEDDMWSFIRNNRALAGLFLAAALMAPAWATTSGPQTAVPGTLNYVEGQAAIGKQMLNSQSVGSVELEPGRTLTTKQGRAELLLTPGVYLRLGNDSSAKMISPDLTDTHLAVNKGEAMVEVDEIHKENDIRISEDGTSTRILKTGLYDFDAAHDQVRVFDGKAKVLDNDHDITVKGGHELALSTAGKLKATSFDKKKYAASDELYRWSSLRSAYLADANENTAQIYVNDGWYGPGWFGDGWYWSPWFDAYTFIPGDGCLFSPFGWGFYSPLWVYNAPGYGYGNYYHHFENFNPGEITRGGVKAGPVYGPGFHGGAVRSFGGGVGGGFRGAVAGPRASGGGWGFSGGHMGGFSTGRIGFHR